MSLDTDLSLILRTARQELYTSQAALVWDLKEKGVHIDLERWKRFEKGETLPCAQTVLKLASALVLPAELITKVREKEHQKALIFHNFQSRVQAQVQRAQEEEQASLFRFLPGLIRERALIDDHVLWSSIPIYSSGYKTPSRMRFSIPLCGLIDGWLDGSLHHKGIFWLLRFEGGNNTAGWVAYEPRQRSTVYLEGMLYHAIMGTGPIMKISKSRAVLKERIRGLEGVSLEHMIHRESLGSFLLYNGWSSVQDHLFWADGSIEELGIKELKVLKGRYLEQLEEVGALSKSGWTKERTNRLINHDRIEFDDLVVTPWSIEHRNNGSRNVLMVANRPLSAPVLSYALKRCREKLKLRAFALWAQEGSLEV